MHPALTQRDGRGEGHFLDRLSEALLEACRDEPGRVAVAASGGVDSTVLLRALHTLGLDVVALHVDHGLRTDASLDGDLVEATAQELGVPIERLRVELAPGNRQGEARRARYAALADAAGRHGCRHLATGHTATDQAETVLMHLVRGSGLRGLAGIPPRRPLGPGLDLVRPLLWATRADVEAEAVRHGWPWREDPSNARDGSLRNRVRHHVLPLLEAEGGADTARRIAASAGAARAALPDLDALAVGPGALGVAKLRAVPDRGAAWVEALAAWAPDVRRTTNLIGQLDRLLEGDVGRHVPVGALVAWRDRDAVRFVRPAAPAEVAVQIGGETRTALGTLTLEPEPSERSDGPGARLDAAGLDAPLTLRTWRPGDRIAPLGLDGTKLVSDVLTERRVRPSERDRQLVLCAGERVAWVVGHRLAAWAAAVGETPSAVRATWQPSVSGPPPRPIP